MYRWQSVVARAARAQRYLRRQSLCEGFGTDVSLETVVLCMRTAVALATRVLYGTRVYSVSRSGNGYSRTSSSVSVRSSGVA